MEMYNQKSSLVVSLHNVEFVKDYHYFISLHLEGDGERVNYLKQRRTDISACVKNPVFASNVFILPLKNFSIDINERLKNDNLLPIQEEKEHILDGSEIFKKLPSPDPFKDFLWRVRVDCRSAIDLPLNKRTLNGLPSGFIEVGWTLYENQIPNPKLLQITEVIENQRHPIWNQQFLVNNEESCTQIEGFLYVCLRDVNDPNPIDSLFIPLESMTPFTPYNIVEIFIQEFVSVKKEFEARAKFYLSFVLEKNDPDDPVSDIVVKEMVYDPFPQSSRMAILMTLKKHTPTGDQKALHSIFDNQAFMMHPTFISNINRIPPIKLENIYNAICVFSLPNSLVNNEISFFLAGIEESETIQHAMPNNIVGSTDPISKAIIDNNRGTLIFTWIKDSIIFPNFANSRASIELYINYNIKELEQKNEGDPNKSLNQINRIASVLGSDVSMVYNAKDKWEVLYRELSQKQEMLQHLVQELDEKTEALKLTGAEIVDLRRQIKLLQSENAILRKKLSQESHQEVTSLVAKEIANMTVEQLKDKIIKIAKSYRDERIKNEELENVNKASKQEILKSRSIIVEYENIQREYTVLVKRVKESAEELQKLTMYKETIKKQEKVIEKLEKMLENTLKDGKKNKDTTLEYEKLKTENLQLKQQILTLRKNGNFEDGKIGIENEEKEESSQSYMKNENSRLKNVIENLREELRSKRPVTSYGINLEKENMELTLKLDRSQARIDALERELTENARNSAKEIAQLKMVLTVKIPKTGKTSNY